MAMGGFSYAFWLTAAGAGCGVVSLGTQVLKMIRTLAHMLTALLTGALIGLLLLASRGPQFEVVTSEETVIEPVIGTPRSSR
jgi:hypothetical protein